MELDELKEAWTALDNRLKRNKELNESIILDMMKSKAWKTVNRFIVYEIIGVVVVLLIIPFCIWALYMFRGMYLYMAYDILMYFVIMFCFVYTFWSTFKLNGLMKIDLSKDVGNNILYVNRYNIQLKKEKNFMNWFGIPVLCILMIFTHTSTKTKLPLWVWTFMICALITGVLLNYWIYKKYEKSIDSILKSLDEIRELKEE